MGCGRLNVSTIAEVRRLTGLREMHFSAPARQASGMTHRNPHIRTGAMPDREYHVTATDPDVVRATIAAARAG
jgi:copper homeostasis protein